MDMEGLLRANNRMGLRYRMDKEMLESGEPITGQDKKLERLERQEQDKSERQDEKLRARQTRAGQ